MPIRRFPLPMLSLAPLMLALFKSMAGVNVVNVNYKGVGPVVNALMAGEIRGARWSRTPVSASSSDPCVTGCAGGAGCPIVRRVDAGRAL